MIWWRITDCTIYIIICFSINDLYHRTLECGIASLYMNKILEETFSLYLFSYLNI